MATATLRRSLNLWQVTLSGIGVILGAGVYALIGPAAAQAGNALWLAFLLAGLTAGLTAYAYARLARLVPKNSPEFQYTALAFGPRLGFAAGALMLLADVLAAAAVTIGFGGYLEHLVSTPTTINALALIVVLSAILFAGVEQSVAVAIVLTGMEAFGLAFVIIVGAPSWIGTDYLATPHGLTGVSGAAALIFFAYLGFDGLAISPKRCAIPSATCPAPCWSPWPRRRRSTSSSRSPPSRSSTRPSWAPRARRSRWSSVGFSASVPTRSSASCAGGYREHRAPSGVGVPLDLRHGGRRRLAPTPGACRPHRDPRWSARRSPFCDGLSLRQDALL